MVCPDLMIGFIPNSWILVKRTFNWDNLSNCPFSNPKIRERKVKTLTINWRDHDGQAHEHTHGNKIELFQRMPSLSCAHIHSLSSDWERRPCSSKYFNFVYVCVFVCLSTVISSISLILCYSYFDTFLSTWSLSFSVSIKGKAWKGEMIKMLKRRKECNTYLTHVCRHYCN